MMSMLRCGCGRSLIVDGPLSVDLDPREARALVAAMAKPVLTRDELADAFWPDLETMPEGWVDTMRVYLARLRHKIIPFGFNIVSAGWVNGPRYRVRWRMERST